MAKEKKEDLFSEENELKPEFWKLDKVGDSTKGVLVDKKIVINQLKDPKVRQTIYTLIRDDGSPIFIGGRGNQDPQVISGLEQAKMGQYVGIKYTGNVKTKSGMHDAKIVKTFTNNEMKEDVLNEYRGIDNSEDTPSAEDLGF